MNNYARHGSPGTPGGMYNLGGQLCEYVVLSLKQLAVLKQSTNQPVACIACRECL